MYRLFLWATKIVPRLPRWLLRLLPMVIGPVAWLLGARARRQATINMLHVLGVDIQSTGTGRRKLRRVVRGMFRSSISNYLDAFTMPSLDHQEIRRRLSVSNEEALQEALTLGKGVILFSAHFGPFEYMAQWFTLRDYSLAIPVEKLRDERVLRLMVELRNSSGANYIPLGGSAPMRQIIQALRKNQIVLITADRAVEGESVVKDFFNAPAQLPIGPVNLSIRTGAPLVGAFGLRVSGEQMEGDFVRLTLALPEDERKQTDLVEAALIKEL